MCKWSFLIEYSSQCVRVVCSERCEKRLKRRDVRFFFIARFGVLHNDVRFSGRRLFFKATSAFYLTSVFMVRSILQGVTYLTKWRLTFQRNIETLQNYLGMILDVCHKIMLKQNLVGCWKENRQTIHLWPLVSLGQVGALPKSW